MLFIFLIYVNWLVLSRVLAVLLGKAQGFAIDNGFSALCS